MYLNECDIHFNRWIYPKHQKVWIPIFIASILLHSSLLLLYFLSPAPQEVTSPSKDESAVHITLLPPKKSITQQQQQEKRRNQNATTTKEEKKSILSNNNPRSKNRLLVPQKHKEQDLSSFLPHANNDFINSLRQEAQNPSEMQASGGDIPIEGKSAPLIQEPRIQERRSVQDMSLFQFTQEFRNRFGAVWNSQDRVLSPRSPLRPGDVVFYKVYINDDGTLNHYENISEKRFSKKDYSHLNDMFSGVISRVFPMKLPPKYAHHGAIITEIVAIQVVDRTLPMQFSF